MSQSIQIKGRRIGPQSPCFLIAEVAQAHDGSLGAAHAYIDAAADAGVDAVKFQTHIADAESTLDEPFRVKFSKQDETRYAYWKRMEFTARAMGWPRRACERTQIDLPQLGFFGRRRGPAQEAGDGGLESRLRRSRNARSARCHAGSRGTDPA